MTTYGISVSIEDFGGAGDGVTDNTIPFQLALAAVEATQYGGEIRFAAGLYLGNFSLLPPQPDTRPSQSETRVTIAGAGIGFTRLEAIDLGPNHPDAGIVLNMIGRSHCTVQNLTVTAASTVPKPAIFGIAIARTSFAPAAGFNRFLNVEVVGNFTRAAVVSVAAEENVWVGCLIRADYGAGVCLVSGSDPAAASVGLNLLDQATLGFDPSALFASSDTATVFSNCEFASNLAESEMVVLSRANSLHFANCIWVGPLAKTLVKFTDRNDVYLAGNTSFQYCHFEGGAGSGTGGNPTTTPLAVFRVDTNSDLAVLQGVQETGGTFVLGRSATPGTDPGNYAPQYLEYDRSSPASLLLLQRCRFTPGAGLGAEPKQHVDLRADFSEDSVFDFTNAGSYGTIRIYFNAVRSIFRGQVRCWNADTCDFSFSASSFPHAGNYPRGSFVRNDAPSFGDPLGWVSVLAGTYDTLPTGISITLTAGQNTGTLQGTYAGVVEGARVHIDTQGDFIVRAVEGASVRLNANASLTGTFALTTNTAAAGQDLVPTGTVGS